MSQNQITRKELTKDMRSYNLALLFNRKKAQQIRRQAAQKIHEFARWNLRISEKDCEIMYAYLKTFGHTGYWKVSQDTLSAFDALNAANDYNRPKLIEQLRAKPYHWAGFWARNIARVFRRYDAIDYQPAPAENTAAIQPAEPESVQAVQTKTPATNTPVVANRPAQIRSTVPVNEAPGLSRKERRQKARAERKEQLRQQRKKLLARQKSQKERARSKRQTPLIVAAQTTARPAPAKSKPGFFKRHKQAVINSLLGGLAFIGSVAGISALYNSAKELRNQKEAAKDRRKIENVTIAQISVPAAKPVVLPAPDAVHKNYYDSAMKIHLGETKRDALYDSLRNMVITQKLSIPEGESIEHLAHVITVSNLVQPNSSTNSFLQECLHSETELSGAKQNKLWHIVKTAGDRAQNIKGSGTHSNFDRQTPQVRQAHLRALNNLRQASR